MRKLDENKKKLITKIARKHFKRLGFSKASMQSIAREAGLAVGTLYLYYPNKAELLRGTVQEFVNNHLNLSQEILASKKNTPSKIKLYLKERFEAVDEVRSRGDRGAELNRKIFELFPERRHEESELMISTLYRLLEQGIEGEELPGIKDLNSDLMVFMHAISWFFLPTDEVYDEQPQGSRLNQIINWFVERWFIPVKG